MVPFRSIGKVFPAEPAPSLLRVTYKELRAAAITVNRSRSQISRRSEEKSLQIERLQDELASYIDDAAFDYQEKAQLLTILAKYRDVFSAMEVAGDNLVAGLGEYDNGARPYYGGNPIARLMSAVRAFVAAWNAAKELGRENDLSLEAGV